MFPLLPRRFLTVGDYVQLEGTVTSQTTDNGIHRVRLASDAGEFEIDVFGDSSVVSGQVPGDVSVVQLGDHILVGGVVNQVGRVGARTLVVAAQRDTFPGEVLASPGTEVANGCSSARRKHRELLAFG